MPSGPGASEGEALERASLICSYVRGVEEGFFLQATSAGQGVLWGEEVVQKRIVDSDWARGVGEGREPRAFSRGDQLFGCPDVVPSGLCKKISPVGSFCSFDGFEVAELGLSCYAVGVGGLDFFWLSGRLS